MDRIETETETERYRKRAECLQLMKEEKDSPRFKMEEAN